MRKGTFAENCKGLSTEVPLQGRTCAYAAYVKLRFSRFCAGEVRSRSGRHPGAGLHEQREQRAARRTDARAHPALCSFSVVREESRSCASREEGARVCDAESAPHGPPVVERGKQRTYGARGSFLRLCSFRRWRVLRSSFSVHIHSFRRSR